MVLKSALIKDLKTYLNKGSTKHLNNESKNKKCLNNQGSKKSTLIKDLKSTFIKGAKSA